MPNAAGRRRGEAKFAMAGDELHALGKIDERAGHDVKRKPDHKGRDHRSARDPCENRRDPIAARQAPPSAVAPRREDRRASRTATAERHRHQQRNGSGANVALKNGAPTEIFSPVSASSASG
jgi:hypothetical protein